MVADAKHNQSVVIEPEAYAQRTVAFFRKYLADEAIEEDAIRSPSSADIYVA